MPAGHQGEPGKRRENQSGKAASEQGRNRERRIRTCRSGVPVRVTIAQARDREDDEGLLACRGGRRALKPGGPRSGSKRRAATAHRSQQGCGFKDMWGGTSDPGFLPTPRLLPSSLLFRDTTPKKYKEPPGQLRGPGGSRPAMILSPPYAAFFPFSEERLRMVSAISIRA